jgi:hypothetical protein
MRTTTFRLPPAQTAPSPIAIVAGLMPTSMRETIFIVRGSIRSTVPKRPPTVQIEPSPTATCQRVAKNGSSARPSVMV